MTGSEHYAAAEELLVDARLTQDEDAADRGLRLAIAQIHATLALAAATALGSDSLDLRAWREAAGTKVSG